VPVYNNARDLPRCLNAIIEAIGTLAVEIIVVDDASTDDSGAIARTLGVQLIRLESNSGQSTGRNVGAQHALGDILFFVDADVVIAPDAMARVDSFFSNNQDVDAVFGSYDDTPDASGLVSQYRNLLHHFTHQSAHQEAITFWAGCGAVRRAVFLHLGGFNEGYYNGRIEDIELGYRLTNRGHRIVLDKSLWCRHLKHWSLWNMIRTDVYCRAVPWSRLLLEGQAPAENLNVNRAQKLSVALTFLVGLSLLASLFYPACLLLTGLFTAGLVLLNVDWFRFLTERRGVGFAVAAFGLHLLYFGYSGLSYLYVLARRAVGPPFEN
ncbi:MAG: glycosyltransferase, partial [Pseudomonadota bacterium]